MVPIQLPPRAAVQLPTKGSKTPTGPSKWGLWLQGSTAFFAKEGQGQKKESLEGESKGQRGAPAGMQACRKWPGQREARRQDTTVLLRPSVPGGILGAGVSRLALSRKPAERSAPGRAVRLARGRAQGGEPGGAPSAPRRPGAGAREEKQPPREALDRRARPRGDAGVLRRRVGGAAEG